MKKYFSIFLLIIFFIIVSQFLFFLMKDSHSKDYVIKNSKEYYVNEKFKYNDDISTYSFLISVNKKDNYYFNVSDDYNKKSRIIENVKFYKEGNIKCIFPILKDNKFYKPLCKKNGELIDYFYLINSGDKNVKKIDKKVKKIGFSTNNERSNKFKKYDNIKIYHENILDNYNYLFWDYKGLGVFDNSSYSNFELLSYDKYENDLALLVNGIYVYMDTVNKDYSKIYLYDIEKKKDKIFKIDEDFDFSRYIYFNGSYDGKIYITDPDTRKQYAFNVLKEKLEEVGNKNRGYVFFDGVELKNINFEEFFDDNMYFGFVNNKKIKNKYNTDLIYKSGNYYCFSSDNKFYRTIDTEEENSQLLFELDNMTYWKIIDNDILIISDDDLYFYNDMVGLRMIISNNEFKYNYKNIVDFWKE